MDMGVAFWGDANILTLIVVMVVQLCEYANKPVLCIEIVVLYLNKASAEKGTRVKLPAA